MTATFYFNMDDPDDAMAHLRVTKSREMALVIWELVHNSRMTLLNHVSNELERNKDLTHYDAVNLVFYRINEILEEQGIKIDELIN